MPPVSRLKVDTNPNTVSGSGDSQTSLASAVISCPSSWGSGDSYDDRTLSPTDVMAAKALPRSLGQSLNDSDVSLSSPSQPSRQSSAASARSSDSSPAHSFGWPQQGEPGSTRTDPFDTTRSFSEDPFGPSGSSSSSGDDIDIQHLATTAYNSRPPVHHSMSNWESQASSHPLNVDGRHSGRSRAFSSPTVTGLLQPQASGREPDTYHDLSTELVDSLQTAIQTLLYVSPPHVLDNAKEQYSGCAVQVPVTTLSALLTSMRGLNYLSANLGPLASGLATGVRAIEDFDIGELLQNVADQLSGEASQADVDIVLFHGDIGMKHFNMNGDRAGIAYVLSYVIRQILDVANRGDTIELGLQIIPQSAPPRRVSVPAVHADMEQHRRRNSSMSSSGDEGPVMCVFEIIHNVSQSVDMNVATPKAELNPFTRLAEERAEATPKLDTELCRRLLRQVQAWIKTDTDPTSPSNFDLTRHGYELSMMLTHGAYAVEPTPLTRAEEAARQPYRGLNLPREPTLGELADFADTLRGRKVSLHASLSSLFARRLTSYLTAWGLDVSHIPIEEESHPTTGDDAASTPKFLIIDDNVAVLRRELLKLKVEAPQPAPQTQPMLSRQRSTIKRPDLFRNTKSSLFIRQASAAVVIHFTSLDKYHQVRDVLASIGLHRLPEVIVVPKPVGPRRLLTALFTAVKQPVVDPVFSPIATSPRSPQISSGNRTPTGGPQEGFFDAVGLQTSDIHKPAVRSPLTEFPPVPSPLPRSDSHRLTPGREDVVTPASEYFSRAATGKSSASGASGVVIQSPDGRPYGMFFEPPNTGGSNSAFSERASGLRRSTISRNLSTETGPSTSGSSPSGSADSSRRPSASDEVISPAETPRPMEGDVPTRAGSRPKLSPATDANPIVAPGRNRSATVTRRQVSPVSETVPRPTDAEETKPLPEVVKAKSVTRPGKAVAKATTKTSDQVIPPINVLIVEDNPINQNILSMFFRKKKIKHQTAKDGQEAVEKWRTGGFHLILMDIQLPVMDGIEATKEIRKMEKMNHIGVFSSTPVGDSSRAIEEAPASSPFRSAVIIVALTASSLQTDRVAALAAGCNDFLTKPVSLKWLEKKTVEWGCMQALIDFDGWRRWKGSEVGEIKRGFQFGPQAAARTVASKLRIDRSKVRKGSGESQGSASSSIDKEGRTASPSVLSPKTRGKALPALPVN